MLDLVECHCKLLWMRGWSSWGSGDGGRGRGKGEGAALETRVHIYGCIGFDAPGGVERQG